MKYAAFSLLLASVLVVACEDRYRFPCQDPKNWAHPKCNPPQCRANETCTKYLIEVPNEN